MKRFYGVIEKKKRPSLANFVCSSNQASTSSRPPISRSCSMDFWLAPPWSGPFNAPIPPTTDETMSDKVDVMTRANVSAGDVYVNHMPLFHTTGCAILVLGGFGIGATMALAPIFDPAVIVQVIAREKAKFILSKNCNRKFNINKHVFLLVSEHLLSKFSSDFEMREVIIRNS